MSIGSTKKPKDGAITAQASRFADTVIRKFPYSEFGSAGQSSVVPQTESLLDKPPLHFHAARRPALFGSVKPGSRIVSHRVSKKRTTQQHSERTHRSPAQKQAQHAETNAPKPAALKTQAPKFKDAVVTMNFRQQPSLKLASLNKIDLKFSSTDRTELVFNPFSRKSIDPKSIVHIGFPITKDLQLRLASKASVSTLARSHHPITVQVAGKMRISTIGRIIDTHIVRPMIWSGMRAVTMSKQPKHKVTLRSSMDSTKRIMQTAVTLPAFSAKGPRTASSEIFIHRGNGLRVQASDASATVAIAGQQRGGKQGKSPVTSAAAMWNPAVAMRGMGRANPTLAYPAPIIMQPIENIDRPEIQINDRLYSVIDQIEPEIGEELLACIIEQLGEGPESLANDDVRKHANSLLPADVDRLNRDTWKALLQETLVVVFQNVLPFDGHGMRKREAIYADAGLLLDIDHALFTEWEACFDIDCLSENLLDNANSTTRFIQDKYESLVVALMDQLGMRANAALTPSHYQGAVIHSFETEAQWTTARFCAISNSKNKVATTLTHLNKLIKTDKNTAARILALITSYSGISRRPATRAPVPRWSKEELQSLIEGLSRHAPSLLSNAQFRSQLTPWENKAFNQLVHRVNHANSMDQLRKLSPKEPFEAFFDLLEQTGQEDEVLLDIWQDMARNLSKLN